MDNDGSIEISRKSIVSPSICILCTSCFNGVGDGLVCNMQEDDIKAVERVLQCKSWVASWVIRYIVDAKEVIDNVDMGNFNEVKYLMLLLMELALSPYWPEMFE